MQTAEGEQFRFVADAAWPALCTTINTDALAAIETQRLQLSTSVDELAALKVEYAAFKAAATTVAENARAIIADTNVSDADSCAMVDAMAAQMLMSKRQRDRAAALVKLAEAQAEADKYED